MTLNTIVHFAAAIFCVGVACYGLSREPRAFVNRIFAIGMVLLALDVLFTALSIHALYPENVLLCQRLRWTAAALLPGVWLLFCLSFPQVDYRPLLAKWKWVIIASFLIYLPFVSLFSKHLFAGLPSFDPTRGWLLVLDRSGYVFLIFFLLNVVLIMALLERVLRASRGRQRWQVKFLTLGLGCVFGARVYTGSQALLFRTLNLQLEAVNAAALLVAGSLILIAMSRARGLRTEIYLSRTVLYNSVTVLFVGVYFLAVGILAKAIRHLDINGGLSVPLGALFIFLALLGLLILLFSDRIRQKTNELISRHFRRSHYDYRKTWADFTQRTSSLVEVKDLCDAVVKMVSQMLDLLSVSIWLLDDSQDGPKLSGSTAFSETQAKGIAGFEEATSYLICSMREQQNIVDLENLENSWAEELTQNHADFLREARIRLLIPLFAGHDLLGLMTVGDRVRGKPFTVEELDLLKTIADQVAGSLLNLKLSERLRKAREMEAFQRVASFFVHDLKNLASSLSMMLQNMPAHFDNPEFREDALSLLSLNVAKLNSMCTRISSLSERLEIQLVETDLNELVKVTLKELNDSLSASIVEELHPVPRVVIDPEQIQKVLTNLFVNAHEAMEDGGEIRVATGKREDWVELTVSDTGCGMSEDVMEECLFQPFKTTKQQGMGIGLFHSKMIVEAHKGRIEVESEEGKGSTFRVLLPVQEGSRPTA